MVPKYSNEGIEYSIPHHQVWDKYVTDLTGGQTRFKKAHGQWFNEDRILFSEEVIPVGIYCNEKSIDQIINFTIDHYQQEAVLAYEVSNNVKLVYRK